MKSMLPTVNTEGGIWLGVCVKDERPETQTVVLGSLPLYWGQEISWRRRS